MKHGNIFNCDIVFAALLRLFLGVNFGERHNRVVALPSFTRFGRKSVSINIGGNHLQWQLPNGSSSNWHRHLQGSHRLGVFYTKATHVSHECLWYQMIWWWCQITIGLQMLPISLVPWLKSWKFSSKYIWNPFVKCGRDSFVTLVFVFVDLEMETSQYCICTSRCLAMCIFGFCALLPHSLWKTAQTDFKGGESLSESGFCIRWGGEDLCERSGAQIAEGARKLRRTQGRNICCVSCFQLYCFKQALCQRYQIYIN